MLAVKSRKTSEKFNLPPKNICFLHISSSYAKILGEKLFRTCEIPQVGQKQKIEKEKKEED